ncbi:MAG: TIGR03936 family radical SAM-associated protein [Ruminococcus sp.]|nr:TIGR03936 family radical SAM-associated protein [Ruminococcus sp.]
MLTPKNQSLIIERWERRLTFAKEGRARYISHLDLMRTMQRAIKRARVPIWYTQGFNPHMYLMFPLALPLGTDSRTESMDISLTEDIPFDTLLKMLNSSMPEGLYFVKAALPVRKHTDIAAAEYEVEIAPDVPAAEALAKWQEFMAQEEINIEKRTKAKKGKKPGVKQVDIKPHIDVLCAEERENGLFFRMRLPAGVELNLNTGTVMDAFESFSGVNIVDNYTKRTKILCFDGEEFI